MTKDEALKMAIEFIHKTQFESGGNYYVNRDKTIKACKEALEQQEQKPKYWIWATGSHIQVSVKKPDFDGAEALYTHPAKQLSDDDIQQITWQIWGCDALEPELDFARAIEAKITGK